ncbi:hypothetical protein HK099_002494, partial [Clydaea vesicula]
NNWPHFGKNYYQIFDFEREQIWDQEKYEQEKILIRERASVKVDLQRIEFMVRNALRDVKLLP